jgi:hypothetical protein
MNNCPNGRIYESLRDANIEVAKQGINNGAQLVAIECDIKNHWHIFEFKSKNYKNICENCTSRTGKLKRRFNNMKSAIDFTLDWNHNNEKKMYPYKCPVSIWWHLTSGNN